MPFILTSAGCTKCTGFKSSFTCGCGAPVSNHTMIVETADEREARGHPLGEATPYAAMGGITGYSSLAEGYMRLDPSGKGKKELKVWCKRGGCHKIIAMNKLAQVSRKCSVLSENDF